MGKTDVICLIIIMTSIALPYYRTVLILLSLPTILGLMDLFVLDYLLTSVIILKTYLYQFMFNKRLATHIYRPVSVIEMSRTVLPRKKCK